MRSFFEKKITLAILAILALAAITLLVSGLREVDFRAGRPLPNSEVPRLSAPVERLMQELANIPVENQVLSWVLLVLVVILISAFLTPEMRRWLITNTLRFLVLVWALTFISQRYSEVLSNMDDVMVGAPGAVQVLPVEVPPPPAFVPPGSSPLLILLVSGILVIAFVIGARLVYRTWKRRQEVLVVKPPLDRLAAIARESLDKLHSGSRWEDVIVESYIRMSEVIGQRRGILRQEDMTPHEFALRLERAGLPSMAVHTLTRLFEKVRYGAVKSTPEDIREAEASLAAILRYVGDSA
jgi:hypothetical protein